MPKEDNMSRELDRRSFTTTRLNTARETALQSIAAQISDNLPGLQRLRIERFDAVTGNPAEIWAEDTLPSQGNLVERALDYVHNLQDVLSPQAAQQVAYIADPVPLVTNTGAASVHLTQYYKDIPVFGASEVVRFAPDGRIKKVISKSFAIEQDLPKVINLTAKEAVKQAAAHVSVADEDEQVSAQLPFQVFIPPQVDISGFEPELIKVTDGQVNQITTFASGPFGDMIQAKLVWLPLNESLHLTWEVMIAMPDYEGQYRVLVDTQNGEILYCHQLVNFVLAEGNVYRDDGGNARQMTDFPRAIADYGIPAVGSLPESFPDDWVTKDETAGNNVIVTDQSTGNTFTGTESDGVVIFDPASSTGNDQRLLNAFYLCNFMHDYFYLLGFRESIGNFQADNYSRGGIQSDRVKVDVYSTTGPTAGMYTQVEGNSPTMSLRFRKTDTNPSTRRHSAFSSGTVFHEYTHGVTNRLVGGINNASALSDPQSRGMGEGWSDYIACTVNNEETLGDWITGNPNGYRHNHYDSNFPHNFGDLGTQRKETLKAFDVDYNQVHAIGEIWCATLMEMNRNIGANLGVQLVFDSWTKLTANPNFLDGRNAILDALDDMRQTDQLNDAEFLDAWRGIWQAFAKFGMGPAAKSNGTSLSGMVTDFDVLSVVKVARVCLGKLPPISVKDDILKPNQTSLRARLEELLQQHF
jgi:extracellular elastinolytic metalloproteinase